MQSSYTLSIDTKTMPSPPHAFRPWLNYHDEYQSPFDPFEIWRGTGLRGEAYFAARNDSIPLIVASQTNDLSSVQDLISRNVPLDEKGMEGETALHMAGALGHKEIVETLIAAGASVNATDEEGSTPLIHCIRFCPAETVNEIASILLSAGASPTHMITLDRDLASHPPLWFAVSRYNNEALVRLLHPLTPRSLDYFPAGSGRNWLVDVAISGADKTDDTSVLQFLIEARSLPIQRSDLVKASKDCTSSEEKKWRLSE